MNTAPNHRQLSALSHDDGIDAWNLSTISPPVNLASDVRSYTFYSERTQSFTARRELPHAEGIFVINLGNPTFVTGGNGLTITLAPGDAFLAGAHLQPALSSSSGTQTGVHIDLPLSTLHRMTGVPMHEFVDRVVSARDVFSPRTCEGFESIAACSALDQRVRRLDEVVQGILSKAPPLNAQASAALRLIRNFGHLDIGEVADRVGWSRKHMAHTLRGVIGIGPKTFRRLLRFQGLIAMISACAEPDWAQAAVAGGYCDQSHLIREFREFAGMTPSDFMHRRRPSGGGVVDC